MAQGSLPARGSQESRTGTRVSCTPKNETTKIENEPKKNEKVKMKMKIGKSLVVNYVEEGAVNHPDDPRERCLLVISDP